MSVQYNVLITAQTEELDFNCISHNFETFFRAWLFDQVSEDKLSIDEAKLIKGWTDEFSEFVSATIQLNPDLRVTLTKSES